MLRGAAMKSIATIGRGGVILICTVVMALLFQNCSSSFSTGQTLVSSSDDSQETGGGSEQTPLGSDSDSLRVVGKSSASAGVDCSLSDASLEYEIKNASSNILLCQEFALTTPSRYGESYSCDSAEKFSFPGSSWNYDSAKQIWTYKVGLRNSSVYVPGSYKLVVKDSGGVDHGSMAIHIVRPGRENCHAGDVGVPSNPPPPPVASPAPQPDPLGSSCVSKGHLICVNTNVPNKVFVKTTYTPNPETVYAFRFATPASGQKVGSGVGTRVSSSPMTKMVVISEVPGDVSVANKPSGCVSSSIEVSTVRYAVNYPEANPSVYCRLAPGKIYYFNVVSKTPNSDKLTCTSRSNCGFSFTIK